MKYFFAAISAAFLIFLFASTSVFYMQSKEVRIKNAAALIREASNQCYALEGRYPEDIDYLARHYGIVLEREKYVYVYRSFDAKSMPYIEVTLR